MGLLSLQSLVASTYLCFGWVVYLYGDTGDHVALQRLTYCGVVLTNSFD